MGLRRELTDIAVFLRDALIGAVAVLVLALLCAGVMELLGLG